ncbi:hypothetical protein SISNIDRAFT_546300 [Sistotremastrum niveocremeum HHB9708]|uniref:HECT-type E3 ubiquitin transferase n=1 Tax=Sistotremastrum niveocremeum HHB9708 TaxID=1314777 RepID=A0A165A0X0_9AGAM|nr:hypothetical protein SISNIDRAFT_546300 [Sistotremastrum niveocremeum HHB9708]
MLISAKSTRRVAPPPPQVASLISTLLTTPEDGIADALDPIATWNWPRSDLHSWIKVLNRFDGILENLVNIHKVDQLQYDTFTAAEKKTLLGILKFEKLLLENSTNRKLFNSYDRLNCLLYTSDLDILLSVLQLILRPAQQYSAQPTVSAALKISTSRLQALAKRWPGLREQGIELADLVSQSPAKIAEVEALASQINEVNFTFYRANATVGATPNAGPVSLNLRPFLHLSKDASSIAAEISSTANVPEEERFELLCRIRTSQALAPAKKDERVKLVIIRLLALSIFAHTHNESEAAATLFLYEPDLVPHISDLLQLESQIPTSVQTAALAALDSLARYRGKIQEVLTAVNAGVSHGILMTLLRHTVSEIAKADAVVPQSFVEALLSFLSFLATHTSGGNLVVGAGLVPLLIQVIENRVAGRIGIVSKTLTLLDNVLYGYSNAFQIFVNSRGVETMVQRIEYEVDLDLQESEHRVRPGAAGIAREHLATSRSALLKHLLRSIHRMMQSSGTSEGLRGLIDSSLPKSIKKIMDNRGLFGVAVLPLAINAMATFVHNEPTYLPVIQEAGLPTSFYDAVEGGLEPSIEVIQATTNAIGALCLNQAGQDQLTARPSIIPSVISVFTSEKHLKVLQDKENASLIGSAIDELIRHHPSLKTQVFDAIGAMLDRIESLGNTWSEKEGKEHLYRLVRTTGISGSNSGTNAGAVSDNNGSTVASGSSTPAIPLGDDVVEPEVYMNSQKAENIIVSYLDIVGKFLESLFQHTAHCRDFITKTDGLERIGRLIALPCLPYDFATSLNSDALVQVIRTMVEVSPSSTLSSLANQVKTSLNETREFWSVPGGQSKLLSFIDPQSPEQLTAYNLQFRKLVTLHIRIALLSDIYQGTGYAHGRSVNSMLQSLTSADEFNILPDLGTLHRSFIWENLVLKDGLSQSNLDKSSGESKDVEISTDAVHRQDSAASRSSEMADSAGLESLGRGSVSVTRATDEAVPGERAVDRNARALKHLATHIPNALAPFFQAIVKMFMYGRRNPDEAHKKQIHATSSLVAGIMVEHLSFKPLGNEFALYAYGTVVISLVTMLLFDERTSQNTLHTVLLLAFNRAGGLKGIFEICQRCTLGVARVIKISEEERTEDDQKKLLLALSGLKVALHLLHSLVSARPLFDSGQTQFLVTRDKKDTDPEYFEPHDFLVKMRLAVLPLVSELWRADWLPSIALGVAKEVVQTLLVIIGGEREEGGNVTVPSGAPPVLPHEIRPPRLPAGPSEELIRQLGDMGFPRSAAERALIRSHNNINAATEYLLAHPLPFPPDPQPSEPEAPSEEARVSAEPPNPGTSVESMLTTNETLGSAEDAEMSNGQPAGNAIEILAPVPSPKQSKEELDLLRKPLKADLGRVALTLVDEQPGLIFDLKPAFVGDSSPAGGIKSILDDIRAFSPTADDLHEHSLTVRFRLLALILSDPASPGLESADLRELMDNLVALLLANPLPSQEDNPTLPKWLASHLLVAQSVLMLGEGLRDVSTPTGEEEIKSEPLFVGPSFEEPRSILLDVGIRLLKISTLSSDELLADLRLLVQLTRDHHSALVFVEREGLSLLLERLKKPADSKSALQVHLIILLRHIIEDKTTVISLMRHEIKRRFAHPRSQVLEATNFVRHTSALVLRDPEAFLEASKATLKLAQIPSAATTHHLQLQDAAPSQGSLDEQIKDSSAMQVDELVSSQTAESVTQFLITELYRVGKTAINHTSAPKTEDSTAATQPDPSAISADSQDFVPHVTPTLEKPKDSDSDGQADYLYACFLMQCLTELLFSYNSCKIAFVAYSKKRSGVLQKDMKHRPTLLNFLLVDMISHQPFSQSESSDTQKRGILCNWAKSVILALCVDVGASSDSKDSSGEITSVRKFVLDGLSKAIKESSTSELLEAHYGKLIALSDLCHRLLTVRTPSVSSGTRISDETPLHMAKLMLEKGFVSTLTSALNDVDLNYPNVRTLVTTILKPLEQLTRVAIKMGRTSETEKAQRSPSQSASDPEMEQSDDEESEVAMDEGGDDTPDLYRNSSLGMYTGDIDDGNYEGDDGDPGDEEDDDGNDVEMEYTDEEAPSDETSEQSDESDIEQAAGALNLENGGSEGWADEDEDNDEDMQDGEDVERDGVDDDDDDEDDDQRQGDVLWEQLPLPDALPADEGVEDLDDDEAIPGMRILSEHDVEEGDALSEELGGDIGLIDAEDDQTGQIDNDFGQWFNMQGNGATLGMREVLFPRPMGRRRGNDEDISQSFFSNGRSRGSPLGTDPTSHPLLVDGNPTEDVHERTSQPFNRRMAGGSVAPMGEVFASIEDLVGGGAIQILRQLVSRTHGAGAEIVGVEVPGAGIMATFDRDHLSRPPRMTSIPHRSDRRVREQSGDRPDFQPLPTVLRWSEESKITHGQYATDRPTRFINHLINALLPAAREAAQKDKAVQQEPASPLAEPQQGITIVDEPGASAVPSNTAQLATPPSPPSHSVAPGPLSEVDVEMNPTDGDSPTDVVPENQLIDNAAIAMEGITVNDETSSDTHEMGDPANPVEAPAADDDGPSTAPEGPSSSAQPTRVTVMIGGNPVDITDTGIDPTFLEALPDDMREEVLNQHFRERRTAAAERATQAAESHISPEFLNALPPEIRAELLDQEAEQARRALAAAPPTGATSSAGPTEMDPASFLATLDPQLRQVVLLEQDDGFLQTLPPSLVAEAGAYRDDVHSRYAGVRRVTNAHPSRPTPSAIPSHREAVQLLDKAGVAVLVRLLFYPHVLRKDTLQKILVNICENAKTRAEVLNLLLGVLHDSSGDVASVDKSFAQLTVRNAKGNTPSAQKASPRKALASQDARISLSGDEISPHLVAQRSISALTYIVSSNDLSSVFFLTEHELPPGMRKPMSRKGKTKERQSQTHFPIALLLGLLDKKVLLKTSTMIESVAALLATVTRPLATLKEKQPIAPAQTPTTEQAAVPSEDNPVAAETAGAIDQTGEASGGASRELPSKVVDDPDSSKSLLQHPPQISEQILRLVVNILTVGECSSKTFQHCLSLIQNLAYIPNAKDTVASELRAKAQDLGRSILRDLEDLVILLKVPQPSDELPSAVSTKFSPASADQAKLLRVLKTIDYIFTQKPSTSDDTNQEGSSIKKDLSDEEKLHTIYDSFNFAPLWKELSACLSAVDDSGNVETLATVLLPLIESLMVVCKNVDSKTGLPAQILRSSASPTSPTAGDTAHDLFLSFTDAHRKALNLMVRNNPSLMSGSFALLVNNPRVLDFDNKRNYFSQQLRRRPHSREHHTTLQLNVRRARVFEDSFHYLQRKTGDQIKYGKLSIRFYEEEGVDAGGLTREWFTILARQMFNPDYALFQPCAADKLTYQPNRASAINPEHLSFFKFIGRIIGKAIYDGRLLDAHFARSLYRQILGKPVDYRDVEWVDPEYYNSLIWILENDPSHLELTFSVDDNQFGENKVVDLKENGSTIPVSQENKREFVQLSAQYRLISSIKEQIDALLGGIYEIIPKDLISIFNEQEVELLISGTPDIDVDEWRAATDYNGYTSSDPVIVWWWRALKSFNREERAKVLGFATGTARVPLSGFTDLQGVQGNQRFSIHKAYGDPDRLPQAHTCFNQIDLPQYTSYEKLRAQLLLAITEGSTGFGFA